jgi:hypothetical protein
MFALARPKLASSPELSQPQGFPMYRTYKRRELTTRQREFIRLFLSGMPIRRAATAAGYPLCCDSSKFNRI